MKYTTIFSYAGSKAYFMQSKVQLYPKPKHDLLIEAFCGGASYSLKYYKHQVWLNDLNPETYKAWLFLVSPGALDLAHKYTPKLKQGDRLDKMLDPRCPEGLRIVLSWSINQGIGGLSGSWNQLTAFGAECYPRLLPKLEYWLPKIAHWNVTNLDYRELPNLKATWFLDPPYQYNPVKYRFCRMNYKTFSYWCRSRKGQAIVCDNTDADYLPFKPIRSSYLGLRKGKAGNTTKAGEAIWTNE